MTTRIDVLGVGVDPLTLDKLLERVEDLVAQRHRSTVAYANVHVLNTAARCPDLRAFLNRATICYCDGNGVVLAARMLGRHLPGRMTGADWIWDLAERAESRRWRLWWIGGEPGVTEAAAKALRAKHPGLIIGTDHGFHLPAEDDAVLERMNAFAPDIVLVGMGTPLQERWVAARRDRIEAPVVWVLGATADFVSGKVPRPGPAWLVDRHEWLSRLIADPRRLWKRYLVGNAVFLGRVAAQRLSGAAPPATSPPR